VNLLRYRREYVMFPVRERMRGRQHGSVTLRNAPAVSVREKMHPRRIAVRHINSFKSSVSVGAVVGLWHLCWVTLVALGWGQAVLDFVLRLHFIQLPYQLAPFAVGTAVALVAVTFAAGSVFGLVFALVWNWLTGEPAREERPRTRAPAL